MSISSKNLLQEYCQQNDIRMPTYKSYSTNTLEWRSNVTVCNMTFKGKESYKRKVDAENAIAEKVFKYITKKGITDSNMKTPLRITEQKYKKSNTYREENIDESSSSIKDVSTNPIVVEMIDMIDFSCYDTEKKTQSKNKTITTQTKDIGHTEHTEHSENIIFNNGFETIDKIDTIYMIDLENKPYTNQIAKSNILFIGFISSIHHSIIKYHEKGWLNPQTDNIYEEIITNKKNMLLYDIGGGVSDLADHYMTMFIYKIVELIKTLNKVCKIYIISGDHAAYCTKICLEKALKWSNNLVCLKSEVNNTIIPPK